MSTNNKKEIPPKERMEGKLNVVISAEFAHELLAYLNKQPREDVNSLCQSLEGAPNLDAFNEQVKQYYKETIEP